MFNCRLSKRKTVAKLVDFGPQPICNRFLVDPDQEELLHPLILGQCQESGLVQIFNPVPADELVPIYDWITYNEPEDHLDDMADTICGLPGISEDSSFCGLTFKDDTILNRLEARGFNRIWRVDPRDDLDIRIAGAGAETIQDRLTLETAKRLVERRGGRVDVVIVRHILEHALDTLGFIQAVKELVNPGGYVIFEVPDCTRALEGLDYTTLWEEHLLYFTETTFRYCFSVAGLSLISFANYPYLFENSLLGIAQIEERVKPALPEQHFLQREKERMEEFVALLLERKSKAHDYLESHRQNAKKIALFGAGHLASVFINILDVGSYFEFVVDDNPHKQSLYMPGSGLPIKPSRALVDENIELCLLSLNPLGEDKVIGNNGDFISGGGAFASIFPYSDLFWGKA
jgi:hypothetical protein